MKNKIIILLLVLILSNFLGLIEVPRAIKFVLIFILVINNIQSVSNHYFHKGIALYFIGIIISIFSCYIYRQQNIIYSVIGLVNYWCLGLFFYFGGKRFTKEDLFSSLVIIGKIVLIVYLIQYILFQFGITISYEEYITDEPEMARFRINCSASIFLLFFIKLQTFINQHKLFDAFWIIFSILVALLMNFRSILLGMILFSVLELWMIKIKFSKNIFAILILIPTFIALFSTDLVQNRIEQMMSRQEEQTLSNSDYIRVIQYDYYETKHFNNTLERLMGSGLPDGHSKYSKEMAVMINDKGLRYVDWGIIGLSWILGILTALGIIIYVLKAYRLNANMPSINVWFLFLLTVSMLTYELPREGNFIIQALALAYLIKSDTGLRYKFYGRM